jgi:uncharacterized membrane protein YqaE (UPF0057 family)
MKLWAPRLHELPLPKRMRGVATGLEDDDMRLILALLLPWLQFFTIGRPFAGLICLLLQLTLIGWLPAAIWSVYALSQYKTDQKIDRALGSRN